MVEKNRHMKLMIRTFNRKTSFTQKYYITSILKAVFFLGDCQFDWALH